VEEREETGEAAGVVGEGAVADSTVVVRVASVEDAFGVGFPNIFDRRSVNIPIAYTTLRCRRSLACIADKSFRDLSAMQAKGCHDRILRWESSQEGRNCVEPGCRRYEPVFIRALEGRCTDNQDVPDMPRDDRCGGFCCRSCPPLHPLARLADKS